uniref:myelin transcription factor 1-like n=1 Tax=Oncorhynchus gorbuscha TaxID=8017 RepID=UPI001EAECA2F|nr:myelin transcription factor 1-like [Oncorhynchus gorbuscha]
MSVESDDTRSTRTRSKGIRVPTELIGQELSVLGCPLVRKRRLADAEAEQEQPSSKRKSHPLKLAMDEGFSVDSDGNSEEEVEEGVDDREDDGN